MVIAELNEERDEEWSALVKGVSDALQEYAMNPNALDAEDKLIFVDTQSLLLADAMAERVNNPPSQNPPTFQELLRIGPLYNSAILVHMTALKLEGVSQDTINARMRDQLQTNFNLVGSGATWCEADGNTPITLWLGKLSQVIGPSIDPQTCYVGQPDAAIHFQVGSSGYDVIQTREYPQCWLFRGSDESCNFVGQVSCPDPAFWGDFFDYENCPGVVAHQMQQCQVNAYNSTWNAYIANPVIQVLWAALSNGEEYLEGQSENLAYVSDPVCAGRLFLGDSD